MNLDEDGAMLIARHIVMALIILYLMVYLQIVRCDSERYFVIYLGLCLALDGA